MHKGNTLSVSCITQSVYKSSLCSGAGRREPCTAHGSSFVGLCQQTKVICWNKSRCLWAKVLSQSTTNCLNCSIKHLMSTFNSQETFKWCLWKIFFTIYLFVSVPACKKLVYRFRQKKKKMTKAFELIQCFWILDNDLDCTYGYLTVSSDWEAEKFPSAFIFHPLFTILTRRCYLCPLPCYPILCSLSLSIIWLLTEFWLFFSTWREKLKMELILKKEWKGQAGLRFGIQIQISPSPIRKEQKVHYCLSFVK